METRKNQKRTLLLSFMSILLSVSMLIGSTFAWFTDTVTSAGSKIQSGTLRLDLEVLQEDGEWSSIKESQAPLFDYDRWEPGYTEVKILKVENEGKLALKWYAKFMSATPVSELADVIDVYVCTSTTTMPDDRSLDGYAYAGTVSQFVNTIETTTYGKLGAGQSAYLGIALKMQETAGNEYQNMNLGTFDITIVATQDTVEKDSVDDQYDKDAEYPSFVDAWDGTTDLSWFLNDMDADTYTLGTAEAFAGFAELINGTASIPLSEDLEEALLTKNFVLTTDVDLGGQNFVPIGGVDKGVAFQGVFDGGNHTIYGLTQSGWDLGYSYGQTAGMGLFGWVGDATIKNLTIDGAEISMEAVVMGIVVGYAAGDCTFENITIKNSQIANYNWDTGGIVGQVYSAGSTFTFKDICIEETTTISGHWGTWDVSAGGVIGRTADGTNVYMEDVYVAAKMDVFNDVVAAYQWYAYRYSGMLVGYTKTTETINGTTYATAPHITCENVTVKYGDWMNYTYCQPSNVSPQYVRVQGGYSTEPYYSGRHWTAGVDSSGQVMSEVDVHTHTEGQAHEELIPFDQLFGGGQGVYGTATHEGVTVIYPN